jgi:hypothetical protein
MGFVQISRTFSKKPKIATPQKRRTGGDLSRTQKSSISQQNSEHYDPHEDCFNLIIDCSTVGTSLLFA